MTFKKGKVKTGGKVKGSQNKLTKTVKEVFTAVFSELQKDPQAKLSEWGKKNPTDFYKLASKLIPAAVEAKIESESGITIFQIPDNGRGGED